MKLVEVALAKRDAFAADKKLAEEMAKIQAAYAEQIGKSVEDAVKEADANEELVRTFGMTKAAIEALEIARMEEHLEKLRGIDMADDEVAALERIIAAKVRSAAAVGQVETLTAAKKLNDDLIADGKRMANSIGDSVTDGLMRGFESGKSFGRNLMDTLKNMFKTLVLQPTIQGTLAPVSGAMASMLPGAAQAATGGSASGSLLGGLMGSIGGIGAGAMQTAGAILSGQIGLGTTLSAGLSAIGTGTASGMMAGFSSVVGALGPIALGIGAAVAIWKKLDASGTYHTGGASSASAAGVSTIRAESLGFEGTRINAETEKMTAGLASGIVSILDSTALAFGKTAGFTAATAFADDTSKDGAWGALLIGKLGQTLVNWQDTRTSRWAPKEFSDGATGQAQYLAALGVSVRTALDSIGLPAWAKTMLDGLAGDASLEDMAKVVEGINATKTALDAMGASLVGFADLSDGAVSALIAASGGIQALSTNASAYYDNFYSDSEKSAASIKQISDALAVVNIVLPESREAWRAQVEAQLALGAAGAPAVAVLLGASAAFAQLFPQVQAVEQAVDISFLAMQDFTKSQYDAADAIKATADAQRSMWADFGSAVDHNMKGATAAAKAMRDFNDSLKLGALSPLSDKAKYDVAKRQYAGADDSTRQAYGTALIEASKAISRIDLARSFAMVTSDISARSSAQEAYGASGPAFWKMMQEMTRMDGSHASGLASVPFNGYRAELHEGEGVLTASENRAYRAGNGNSGGGMSEATAERLIAAIERLQGPAEETAKQARSSADTLTRVTKGGKSLLTTAA